MINKYTAILSCKDNQTSFRFGDFDIRYETSPYLEKYLEVVEWDNGYLVVMAKYSTCGVEEEYADIAYIFEQLGLDVSLLKDIDTVEIGEFPREVGMITHNIGTCSCCQR